MGAGTPTSRGAHAGNAHRLSPSRGSAVPRVAVGGEAGKPALSGEPPTAQNGAGFLAKA